jgi:hypothetical protein
VRFRAVAVVDAVLGAEGLVSLVAHAIVIDAGQPPVPFDELVGRQPASPRHRSQLSDLHTVPGDVVDLPPPQRP